MHAIADRHAPAAIRTFQRRIVVGVSLHRLLHLPAAESTVGQPAGRSIALLNGVLQSELQWVHTQLLRKLVHDRFHGVGGLGLTGRPVRLGLGPVADDVIAVYKNVVYLVCAKGGKRAAAHGRPRVGSGLVG